MKSTWNADKPVGTKDFPKLMKFTHVEDKPFIVLATGLGRDGMHGTVVWASDKCVHSVGCVAYNWSEKLFSDLPVGHIVELSND